MTRRRFLTVLSLIVLQSASLFAQSAEPKTVRLLTVGNSFSQNATRYLGDLAKANGDTLILQPANVGGASMELHWTKATAFEKDPTDKFGVYNHGKSLRTLLQGDRWDFVTIQQASIKSHDIATYRPFAKSLAGYIRQHAPGAKLMVHQTWAYRVDDPRFTKLPTKPGEPETQEAMYKGLRHAYSTIAKELNAGLIPVGDAFHLVDTDPNWGYRAPETPWNPAMAKGNELPKQPHSLHVGWARRKGRDGKVALRMDGHHANMAGEYLGACVWYEVLFGRNVEPNSFVPEGLDPEFAKFLRATAHQVVSGKK